MTTIDQENLGRRLRDARVNCDMTQDAAAEALGLPRTVIGQVESGTRTISTLELGKLAELYSRSIVSFFEEEPDDALLALCRVSPVFRDHPRIQKEIRRYVEICKEGASLRALLSQAPRPGPPSYDLSGPKNAEDATTQGFTIAVEERKRLGIGDGPLADIAELICGQGIWASRADLPDPMSGLFLRHPSTGMVILVNHEHKWYRRRFSYAHEYAHALLDRKQPARVTSEENASELIERRANAFASAFLLPQKGVDDFLLSLGKGHATRQRFHIYDVATDKRNEVEQRVEPGSQKIGFQDVAMLQHCFGVSYETAVFRLDDLGLIKKPEKKPLLAQEDVAKRYRKMIGVCDEEDTAKHDSEEGDTPDPELKMQIAGLAIDAFRRELISQGKLFDLSVLLGISGADLVEAAQESLVAAVKE